jgi:hypothetical protein
VTTTQLREDYRRWHRLQVATRDVDPVYPVLARLADDLGLDDDATAWLCLLHVTYYHLGSALAAFAATGKPTAPTPELLRLPTGTERRAHRVPGRLEAHWLALLGAVEDAGGPAAWLCDLPAGVSMYGRWTVLNDRVAAVHGNGRWAAYKTAELAQKVVGAQVRVADAGHAHSSGPRQGLALLHPVLPVGNGPDAVAILDRLTDNLAVELAEPDIGQVETSLCDFHSLARGGYYLGHDIDAMQQQLAAVPSDLTGPATAARLGTLPAEYLGEIGGWTGPDRDRKRVYARTGVIVERP